METVTIFVELQDEGSPVWRPVEAERLDAQHFRLKGPVLYDEAWAFPPGAVVRTIEKTFADGTTGLVAVGSEGKCL